MSRGRKAGHKVSAETREKSRNAALVTREWIRQHPNTGADRQLAALLGAGRAGLGVPDLNEAAGCMPNAAHKQRTALVKDGRIVPTDGRRYLATVYAVDVPPRRIADCQEAW